MVTIEGRCFPVEIFYTKNKISNYIEFTIETIIKIHKYVFFKYINN
jgi:HrpA-like RNA helicase